MIPHRFWTRLATSVATALFTNACHHAPETGPGEPQPPAGEVWLTPQQMLDAKIEVQPVTDQQVDDAIRTSGTVTLDDLRAGHVFSPVTGRVVSIIAALGQHVRKGDPLATIESPDIGSAVSDVHKAQADMLAAEHDLKRKKALFEEKAGPQADVEAANDTYRKAKAELERAGAKEQLLRVGSADAVTQRFTLSSPVDGEVLLRNINPGVEVQGMYSGGANVELFTIGELDRVWVLGDLYEMDFRRVHPGEKAVVTVVAYPERSFQGTVDWVSGAVDPNTRTAKVRCVFDNPGRFLRPMMYATMQIAVSETKTLAIPKNALFRLGDDRAVFVELGEQGGYLRFKQQNVDVEFAEDSPWLAIKNGLVAGQKVVTKGGILLAE
jgi:cobalt-zinc-cadmium efflux system membrane fusion protein